MILFGQLFAGTVLGNVRAFWVANGVAGSVFSSGITQPDTDLSAIRVDASPPTGAEELFIYDNTDKQNNFSACGYRLALALQVLQSNSGLLNSLGDPWNQPIPGSYPAHSAGAILGKLDRGAPAEPVTPIVSPSQVGQVVGWVYAYDEHGALLSDAEIEFEMVSTGLEEGSFGNDPFTATSDDNGFLSAIFPEQSDFRARRGANGRWMYFTTPARSDDVVANGFSLPKILGKS